jgi:hypothetical protein
MQLTSNLVFLLVGLLLGGVTAWFAATVRQFAQQSKIRMRIGQLEATLETPVALARRSKRRRAKEGQVNYRFPTALTVYSVVASRAESLPGSAKC